MFINVLNEADAFIFLVFASLKDCVHLTVSTEIVMLVSRQEYEIIKIQ